MKKEYMKPAIQVVKLQYRMALLLPLSAQSNLDPEDKFDVEEEPAGNEFWGR